MEKLIELLNEYQKTILKIEYYTWRYEDNSLWHDDENDLREGDNFMGDVAESYAISKKFGFIKWLVENDKIDFEKIQTDTEGKFRNEFYNEFEGIISFSNMEMLLMYLAISDTPIDDLISLLK